MYAVQQTETFVRWLAELRDPRAKARIVARLQMTKLGHLGDVNPVGEGILEMRVDVGPGYRLYFARRTRGDHPFALRWRQIDARA